LTRCLFVFLLLRRHPRSPLFPYTTLFRSGVRPGPPHGREAPPGPSVCASGPSARRARALPPGSVPDRIRPGRLPAPVGRVIRGARSAGPPQVPAMRRPAAEPAVRGRGPRKSARSCRLTGFLEESSGENISSEALRLRALAHPVRLDLLYLLREEGEVTATAAAERLGLSPKTCSYHLGLLGKYGLAEETGGGKGRSRPWRLVP